MHIRPALRALAGLYLLALVPGCGREFSAPPEPPPALEIVDFHPKKAFQGDLVALCGENLGTADQDTFSLLAFFGTQAAEVVFPAPVDLPLECADERIALRVPAIAGEPEVELTLSSATSQATSLDTFRYQGPGHPEAEETSESLRIASAPSSVSVVLPFESLPFLTPALVTNTTARSLSVMDWETGWHVDFGLGAMPLSAAFVPEARLAGVLRPGDEERPVAEQVTGTMYPVPIYITAMAVVEPTDDEPGRIETLLLQQRLELFVPDGGSRNRFEVFMADIPAEDPFALALPVTAPGDPPFQPYQVFQFCLTEAEGACGDPICDERLLALTDLERPRMALYSYRPCDRGVTPRGLIELSTADSLCADDASVPQPGAIVDLELMPLPDTDPAPGDPPRMHAVVQGRPEVWTVTLGRLGAPWSATAELAWPTRVLDDVTRQVLAFCHPDSPPMPAACADADLLGPVMALAALYLETTAGLDACQIRHAALAMLDWSEAAPVKTLYFSEPNLRTVFEAHYVNTDVTVGAQTVHVEGYAPLRRLALPSQAFALTAWMDETQPWLAMACEDGLRLSRVAFHPDGPIRGLEIDGFLGLPGSRGTPQALTRYGRVGDSLESRLLLADTVRDRLLVLPAGELYGDPMAHQVGVSQPQVAASQYSDLLYVADPLQNAIRLVDELSGVQDGQFSVQDISSFGASDITCLHSPAGDVLLVPLAEDYNRLTPGRSRFRDIITRGADSADAVFDTGEIIGRGGKGDGGGTLNEMAHGFNEILAAPRSDQYYLVSYEDDPTRGFIPQLWSSLILGDPAESTLMDAPDDIQLIDPDWVQVSMPLSSDTQLVRLDPEERALALWTLDAEGVGTLEFYRNAAPDPQTGRPPLLARLTVAAPAAALVTDLALHVRGEILTAYLALPGSGHLLVLRPYRLAGADRDESLQAFLETAGVPERLSWSPDGRRLYVLHRIEGKLSILETDCMPAPQCQQVSDCAALTTGELPAPTYACDLGYCIPQGFDGLACPQGTQAVPANPGPEGGRCVPSLCERVRTTLAIPASPARVVFHPSGKAAYVTHTGSGEITVIR